MTDIAEEGEMLKPYKREDTIKFHLQRIVSMVACDIWRDCWNWSEFHVHDHHLRTAASNLRKEKI